MAALQFIDISYPWKAASAFKQAALEHVNLIMALKSANIDVYPLGDPDGVNDIDTEHIGYHGISLGGIVGGISTPLAQEIMGVASLSVGGGGLIDFVEQFLQDYGIDTLFPIYYMDAFATIAQTILESGDAMHYAPLTIPDGPDDLSKLQVFSQMAIDDDTVPNRVTENWARAAALTHMRPVERAFGDLDQEDLPYDGGRIIMQFDPASHNFVGSGEPHSARVRGMIFHFFQSYFDTGVAEIAEPEL